MGGAKTTSSLESKRIVMRMQEKSTKIISVSKKLSLRERIAVVNRLIREWMENLAEPVDHNVKGLFLTEYKGTSVEYIYRYEIFDKYPKQESMILERP